MMPYPPFSLPSLVFSLLIITFFIVLRYLLLAGFFYWALWKRPPEKVHARRLAKQPPSQAIMRHEIYWSVVSSFVYAASGVWIIEAWRSGGTRIYFDVADYGVPYLFVSLAIYMFLHDTYFYWTHRAMHHPKIFPVVHKVHHESRQPTPWAGFSFHPTEAVIGALIIPVLVSIIPVHAGVLIFMLVLMTVTGITNHAGWEIIPDRWISGFIGKHWISATHHNVHHLKYKTNFALYFRFWDRLMGTDEMELPDTVAAAEHS